MVCFQIIIMITCIVMIISILFPRFTRNSPEFAELNHTQSCTAVTINDSQMVDPPVTPGEELVKWLLKRKANPNARAKAPTRVACCEVAT